MKSVFSGSPNEYNNGNANVHNVNNDGNLNNNNVNNNNDVRGVPTKISKVLTQRVYRFILKKEKIKYSM